MYTQMDTPDFPRMEQQMGDYWKEHKCFEKSLGLSDEEAVFYDGPPFPTGAPHHGTVLVSVLKDALARFLTMSGKSVPRVWGWDCHGLPVEKAVEKALGVGRRELEKDVGSFNQECRKLVLHHNEAWEVYVDRLGRWVDYRNCYRTMDRDYMESVLWVFKHCYDKGLVHKDYRVTPYCVSCQTSLSVSDTREGDALRERTSTSALVMFECTSSPYDKPCHLLAWTTTPWTLPANLALTLAPDARYAVCDVGDGYWVFSESVFEEKPEWLPDAAKVLKTVEAEDLAGWAYEPLFPYFADLREQGCFRVLLGEFVNRDDGVGVVHTAPGFGDDDYWVCKEYGLPVVCPMDERGRYTHEVGSLAGQFVLDSNDSVVAALSKNGAVVHTSPVTHKYPHCWRCREPLVYRAMDSWYFRTTVLRQRMLELNEDVNWTPEHVKHGRFGKWLENCRDWNLSRSRFWGTPVPVWECDQCEEKWVAGSCDELEAMFGVSLEDLHKEHLDPLTDPCKCGGTLSRVPEVLDCWFDSGAMPFAQCHYPFENREWFESHFPADFVVEYPGQLRGWFYYLHVLATAVMDKPAFRNCLVHGTLLAADGSKVSKSRGNYTDPMVLLDNYGSDAVRCYLLRSPAAAMADFAFQDDGVRQQVRDVLLPLWNTYVFFASYANVDGYEADGSTRVESTHVLDRWLLSRVVQMTQEAESGLTAYDLNAGLVPALELVEDLTSWYVRLSRKRFWSPGMALDKKCAFDSLHCALVTLSQVLAPSLPFLSDWLFRSLTGKESVHLTPWPSVPEEWLDPELLAKMDLMKKLVTLGRALRQRLGFSLRQPLPRMYAALPTSCSADDFRDLEELVRSELNVKHLVLNPGEAFAEVECVPRADLLGPRLGSDFKLLLDASRNGTVELAGNEVVLSHNGRRWHLARDEVRFRYHGKSAREVVSDQGLVVSFDTDLTPELVEEGVMNELKRCVQNMRREAGCKLDERVDLELCGRLDLVLQERLAENALADLKQVRQPDLRKTFSFGGREFELRLKRP